MIKATKIKMYSGQQDSNSLTEIEFIYLTGVNEERFYKKESVHDFIVENPESPIHVDIAPYPILIAAIKNTQKYVRSESNDTPNDNLLKLPIE